MAARCRPAGTIPWELSLLSDLSSLDLSYNYLDGSIPTGFGNCLTWNNLISITIRWRGTIPTEIGQMTALTRLVFQTCH
jgi:Leucine-rich repeat (LRR) protein